MTEEAKGKISVASDTQRAMLKNNRLSILTPYSK